MVNGFTRARWDSGVPGLGGACGNAPAACITAAGAEARSDAGRGTIMAGVSVRGGCTKRSGDEVAGDVRAETEPPTCVR